MFQPKVKQLVRNPLTKYIDGTGLLHTWPRYVKFRNILNIPKFIQTHFGPDSETIVYSLYKIISDTSNTMLQVLIRVQGDFVYRLKKYVNAYFSVLVQWLT